MGGSLTGSSNRIKDVYTKLVFYNTTDGKFYRDTGTETGDVEVVVGDDLVGVDNILKHNTSSTLSSGDIMQILNNDAEVFSIDHQGALHLKAFSSAPTDNGAGTLYYDSVSKTLKLSVPE
jgi:hypothetical protein|tara:strand:- start:1601 stop:1960 length:360 start_codon:yes stop_codon:yes gene_type:complete